MKIDLLPICLFFLFINYSCKSESYVDNCPVESISIGYYRAPIAVSDMAYSSLQELQSVYQNDTSHVIHYKVARLVASMELLSGQNANLNIGIMQPWHLTALPKIVYNYDNTPKYYEFGYVVDNQIVATITTYARKEIAGALAFIFEDPLSYDCPTLDYYVGRYPSRYYGTGGVCYLKNCDEELDSISDFTDIITWDHDIYNKLWDAVPIADKNDMLIDCSLEGSDITTILNEELTKVDEFWGKIDSVISNEFPNLLDENGNNEGQTLDLNLQEFLGGNPSTENNEDRDIIMKLMELLDRVAANYEVLILPEYNNDALKKLSWNCFCGPAACAWVYRGKYEKYNDIYIPLHGENVNHNYINDLTNNSIYNYTVDYSSKLPLENVMDSIAAISHIIDNGLIECFYKETVPFKFDHCWQFPLYHGGLNRGFKAATSDEYKVKFTMKPYEYMWNNQEPLIIETCMSDASGHYFVAFGSSTTYKTNGEVADVMYMITDNGTLIGSHNYKPYLKRSTFWNLHYGLKKK